MTQRRWWSLIGPWPFRPALMTVMMGFFFVALRNGSRFGQGEGFRLEWLTEGVVGGLTVGGAFGVVMYLGLLWQQRFGLHWGSYVLFILLSSAASIGVRALMGDVDWGVITDPASALVGLLRLTLATFLILSLTGVSARRLVEQVARTNAALDLAQEQAKMLLKGDEDTRAQIASALHDRVQARLIAICMELQLIDTRGDAVIQRAIDSAVQRVEDVRGNDVRRAARALSPSLAEVGLESALEELAQQYLPGMLTTIVVDSEVDSKNSRIPPRVLLGAYRIIEQALLNAGGHGAANACRVLVRVDDDGAVQVVVSDDGRGFPENREPTGFGSTLMTTWAQSLNGTWSWRSGDAGGVRVEAHFPWQG